MVNDNGIISAKEANEISTARIQQEYSKTILSLMKSIDIAAQAGTFGIIWKSIDQNTIEFESDETKNICYFLRNLGYEVIEDTNKKVIYILWKENFD